MITRLILIFTGILALFNCSCSSNLVVSHQLISDTIQIRNDMDSIVKTAEFRNYKNLTSLNKVADYIKRQFQSVSDSVVEQNYFYKKNNIKISSAQSTPIKKSVLSLVHIMMFVATKMELTTMQVVLLGYCNWQDFCKRKN